MIKCYAFKMLCFVMLAVFLNILSAIILKESSMRFDFNLFLICVISILVFILNLSKLLLWAYIHKNYPISRTLPLTSLFYPLIFIIALYYGETFTLNKALGSILLIIGIVLILYEESKSSPVKH